MTAISRREFGRVVIVGVPAAAVLGPAVLGAAAPVVIGVSGTSFRDLPRTTGRDNVDDVIRAMKSVGANSLELALATVEPAPPSTAPFMGGSPAYPQRIVLTPEQVASTNAAARSELRTWRARTPISVFEEVASKFAAAGITVHACSVAYNDSFTDDEIDTTFRQVKALGATTVSSPLTMAMAARLVPFAAKHRIDVAIHNDVDGNKAGAIATGQLKDALALSPSFTLKLDIGNVTASNCDAIAELRTHQSRVSHVLVKDRLRNAGGSQPFGEGDTPIVDVLAALKTSARPIPALVEYDYIGLRPAVDEVKMLVEYVRRRA